MDEDPFAKNSPGISKNYHEFFFVKNFLQTKPQVKNMNINYYDFYYTVIKNRDAKANADNQNEHGYNNFNDIVLNHYVGRNMIMNY